MKAERQAMGKAYSYTRFSMKRQSKGQSVERQTRGSEKWASEHGYTLDTELSMFDLGLSAYHQRHVKSGALGVFLRAIEDGKVAPGSVLIVEGLDRLSRAKPLDAQAQLTLIINAGVTVVTVLDNKIYSLESINDNPMDLIYSLLVMIRAHEESKTKSDRAKDAIESQCRRWIEGSFRGCIRAGADPAWVQWDTETRSFQLVEDEAAKMRRIVELHLQGYTGYRIAQTIEAEGYSHPLKYKSYQAVADGLRVRAHLLIGTRLLKAGRNSIEYQLENYYPALIDETAYNEIISNQQKPKRRGRIAEVPSIFTSHNGLFRCGYCGCCLGVNRLTKPIVGRYNRARCDNGNGCRTGSSLLDPLEKAVINWCSDQMNLNSLVGQDQSAEIKNRLAASRASVRELERRLAKNIEAMEADDAPASSFAKRAKELETQIATLAHSIRTDEGALMTASHKPTIEAAEVWKSLATAAMNDDTAARMAVRKMVGDTFQSVVLYRHGVVPLSIEETKHRQDKYWELALVSKSGVTRHLRINRDGDVIRAFDEASAAA